MSPSVIAVQYPVLRRPLLHDWMIGTGTRRLNYLKPTGFRYIHWGHEVTKTERPTDENKISFDVAMEVWNKVMTLSKNILVYDPRKRKDPARNICPREY